MPATTISAQLAGDDLEHLILPALLIVAGLGFAIRNVLLLRSEAALRNYIETSPKAVASVQKYGVEGAMKMAKESSIPFGIAVSLGMCGVGVWVLLRALA